MVGHGTAAPAREWRAVARIDGEVVMTAERLAAGETMAGGTELLRLDDTDLKLSLAQIEAQLAALDVKDATLAASLEIARADLALSQAELKRQQDLTGRGVSTQAALDQSRRQELAARAKVVDLENQLALNDAERKVLERSATRPPAISNSPPSARPTTSASPMSPPNSARWSAAAR